MHIFFSDPLELFLLGVHIRPDSVCNELTALEQAYLTTSDHFDGARGLMLGDFNAGCRWAKIVVCRNKARLIT